MMSLPNDNSPLLLVSALKSGDRDAFAQIYNTYSPSIYHKLLQIVGRDKIAEELLQTLFVKLWEKRATIDVRLHLEAYLGRMAANIAFDYFRKLSRDQKAREAFLQQFKENYDILPEGEPADYRVQQLESLIDRLPPQRKKVLQLCKLQGKTYQEASLLLGISVSTVNDHIVKATRMLRRQLLDNKPLSLLLFLIVYHL